MCKVHHLPGRELCAASGEHLLPCGGHSKGVPELHGLMFSRLGGCQCLHRNTLSPLGWCLRLKKAWDVLGGSGEPWQTTSHFGGGFPTGFE